MCQRKRDWGGINYFTCFWGWRIRRDWKNDDPAFCVASASSCFSCELKVDIVTHRFIRGLLHLYLKLNSLSKGQWLCWFVSRLGSAGLLNFLDGVKELGFVFLKERVDVDDGWVFGIGLGLDMFEGARRPPLMTGNATIHTSKLPKNIVAVLFIINLVIELLRGISLYLDFKKPPPLGFYIYLTFIYYYAHYPFYILIYTITTPRTSPAPLSPGGCSSPRSGIGLLSLISFTYLWDRFLHPNFVRQCAIFEDLLPDIWRVDSLVGDLATVYLVE